jgi:hypothetical protein
MLLEEEKNVLRYLVRERAAFLRDEQRKIDKMRDNIRHLDFMQKEYVEYCNELIELNILFTKLCYL